MKLRSFLAVILCLVLSVSNAKTVAISYFDNTSGDVKLSALSKGIADMLITDLSKIQGVTIVEREKLEKLLQEIKLGQSKYFDPSTAQKLGKGLGAQTILTGSFYVLENTMRIDARLIDVATGGIITAEEVIGSKNNFFELHKKLVTLLTKNMNIKYDPNLSDFTTKNKEVELTAVVNFSNAIILQDQGMEEDAKDLLEQTVKKYPKFNVAKDKLNELRIWMQQIEVERDKLLDEEFKTSIATLDTSSDMFGSKLSTTWSALLTGFKYERILQFNNLLRTKKYNLKRKLYGEYSPMTLGEMLLFYDCMAYSTLKKHNEVLEVGKQFMSDYPTSMYFTGIKMQMDQSIKELEDRENGKKNLEIKLHLVQLDVYSDFLKKLEWKSNYQFISENEYSTYRTLYENTILNTNTDIVNFWDESGKFDALTSFNNVADIFHDIKTFEDIISFSKKIFIGTTDEGKIYNLEKDLYYVKKRSAEAVEKTKKLEIAIKSNNRDEAREIINFLFEYEICNKPKLTIELCEKYISQKPSNDQEKENYTRAWTHLVYKTALVKGTEAAEKIKEEFKKTTVSFGLSQEDYTNTLRQIENEINTIKSEYTNYLLYLKNLDPELKVLEQCAKTFSENHQYLEEASARRQILDRYNLNEEQESYQLYALTMTYTNQGYFSNARKTAKILIEKYPKNNLTQSIVNLINFMPK